MTLHITYSNKASFNTFPFPLHRHGWTSNILLIFAEQKKTNSNIYLSYNKQNKTKTQMIFTQQLCKSQQPYFFFLLHAAFKVATN